METRRCDWVLLPPLRTPTCATKLIATAPNGRETLGLRPALRQAAPVCRQRLRRRGASSTRRRGSGFGQSHDKPPSGDSLREFVLHSLRLHPSGLGGAACLRDIPCGNVVSRWTLADMRPPNGTPGRGPGSSTSESHPNERQRNTPKGTPAQRRRSNQGAETLW